MHGLALSLLLPPLLSGGWSLKFLPVFTVLGAASWWWLAWTKWRRGHRIRVPYVGIGLLLLAVFTLLQAIHLGEWLHWISPKAASLRDYLAPEASMSISYEQGATIREATKLLLYFLVIGCAFMTARTRGSLPVLQAVALSGAVSIVAAFAQNLSGVNASWYVAGDDRPTYALTTTFQNPNHSAAFCVLVGCVAYGVFLDTRRKNRRIAFIVAASIFFCAALVEPSKGGILSFFIAVVWLYILSGKSYIHHFLDLRYRFVMLLTILVVFVVRLEEIRDEFGLSENGVNRLGLYEKWAAMKDSIQMSWEHFFVGIGRGSYVSIYPHYQTSELQLVFTFPENIIAQYVSEWGVLVGSTAVLGMIWAVYARYKKTDKASEKCALVGVSVVILHDLFDFGLEIPGIAILVAVIIGASTPRRDMSYTVPLNNFFVIILPIFGVFLSAFSCYLGDFHQDLRWFREQSNEVLQGGVVSKDEAYERLEKHPVNAILHTQMGYLLENNTPLDVRGAMRQANRALLLGPTYADAYLLTSRLLLKNGHRAQGFRMLSRAWILSNRRTDITSMISYFEPSGEELLLVLPRSNQEKNVPSLKEGAFLAARLLSRGQRVLTQRLLSGLDVKEKVQPEVFFKLCRLSLLAGLPGEAFRFSSRGLTQYPNNILLKIWQARAAVKHLGAQTAQVYAKNIEKSESEISKDLIELHIQIAIAEKHFDDAISYLDKLRMKLPLTSENQTVTYTRQAQVYLMAGRPDLAIPKLKEALEWSPSSTKARYLRAKALDRLGRRPEAIQDLRALLRRDSKHRAALQLLKSWRTVN